MRADDQTAVNTPNTDTSTDPSDKLSYPAVSSEFKGHTLMQEHHSAKDSTVGNESCRTNSLDVRSDVESVADLSPYDEYVLASRPHLPVAIRTPARPQLPVRVACHRGDWRNFVENTIEAVESCIAMGADIVEVDVWRSKDGVLILNHDETLGRTTDLPGKVSDYTYEELKDVTLKDGLGNMTEFKLATVEQLLNQTKDRVFVNLDKADLYLRDVVDILERTGLVEQVILKSETPYLTMCKLWGVELMNQVIFMPVFNVKPETTVEEVETLFKGKHDAYEINFEKVEGCEDILKLIKELAERDNAVLWINTIWRTTCGGHSDDRAFLKDKDANWGFIVSQIGGGILQTDRPALLLEYLKARELR